MDKTILDSKNIEKKIESLKDLSNKYEDFNDSDKIKNLLLFKKIIKEKDEILKILLECKNNLDVKIDSENIICDTDLLFKEATDTINSVRENKDLEKMSLSEIINLYSKFYEDKIKIEKYIQKKKMVVVYLS